MAVSKCGTCGKGFFESVEVKLPTYRFNLILIQCASCGSVVNAVPAYDPGAATERIEKVLADFKRQLDQIEHLSRKAGS